MKHFRLLALAAALLTLGACAQVKSVVGSIETAVGVATSASVSPKDAYIAINAFDAVEATATKVLRLPLCNGSNAPCRAAGLRENIRKVVLAGRVARNDVKAYLRANPGKPLAVQSFSDLKAATASLQSIVAAYKSN